MSKLDGMLTACKVVKCSSQDFKQAVIWCLHREVIVGKWIKNDNFVKPKAATDRCDEFTDDVTKIETMSNMNAIQ